MQLGLNADRLECPQVQKGFVLLPNVVMRFPLGLWEGRSIKKAADATV